MGPREEQRGPDLPPGRWGAAGGAELGRATEGVPLLGSVLPAPLPGLAAAPRGARGRRPRVTRASRASHVLGRDHGGEGQGDRGDPGALQHHFAPPGAAPPGHQGLRGRDQRYATPSPPHPWADPHQPCPGAFRARASSPSAHCRLARPAAQACRRPRDGPQKLAKRQVPGWAPGIESQLGLPARKPSPLIPSS